MVKLICFTRQNFQNLAIMPLTHLCLGRTKTAHRVALCAAFVIQQMLRLKLAIPDAGRIIAVTVTVTDRTVWPMDHKLGLLVSSNLSPSINSIPLRWVD